MDKTIGVVTVALIAFVLLITGQLLSVILMLVLAAFVGYAWYSLGNKAFDDVAKSVQNLLAANILYLEGICNAKSKDKTDQRIDKRKLTTKLTTRRVEAKEVDRMLEEQHGYNKIGGICIGIAVLLIPSTALTVIACYLILRWLLIPRYQPPVKTV